MTDTKQIIMKKYIVSCDIISGTLSAVVEAENKDKAKEIFDELGADEFTEEPDRRLENFQIEEMKKTYKIIRFYRNGNKNRKTIKTGLSFEEAKEHCTREDTHGDGWFDGFEEE